MIIRERDSNGPGPNGPVRLDGSMNSINYGRSDSGAGSRRCLSPCYKSDMLVLFRLTDKKTAVSLVFFFHRLLPSGSSVDFSKLPLFSFFEETYSILTPHRN